MERWLADAREASAADCPITALPSTRSGGAGTRRLGASRDRSRRRPEAPSRERSATRPKRRRPARRDAGERAAPASTRSCATRTSASHPSTGSSTSRPVYRFDQRRRSVGSRQPRDARRPPRGALGRPSARGTIVSVRRRLDLARSLASISLRAGGGCVGRSRRDRSPIPRRIPPTADLRIEPILGLVADRPRSDVAALGVRSRAERHASGARRRRPPRHHRRVLDRARARSRRGLPHGRTSPGSDDDEDDGVD